MTYAYIKQHKITGLRYFGITSKDPFKYRGSGTRWLNHLRTHKNLVDTIWTQSFAEQDELTEFCLLFSKHYNIVADKGWANLKIEDGIVGGIDPATGFNGGKGRKQTQAERSKRSNSLKGIKKSKEHCIAMSVAKAGKPKPGLQGYKQSTEHKAKLAAQRSIFAIGNTNSKGRRWWTDGITNKKSIECPGPDWSIGRILAVHKDTK